MARNLFPFEKDRAVIHAFLMGTKVPDHAYDNVLSTLWTNATLEGALGVKVINGTIETWRRCMFIDKSSGGLEILIRVEDTETPYLVRAINWALEHLGMHERVSIERNSEWVGPNNGDYNVEVKIVYDGAYLTSGVPFKIMGHLPLVAWRSSQPPSI